MISSKVLLEQAGISRATLNNYIQLGILSRPAVMAHATDAEPGHARLLGYFPPDSVERVKAVQSLKSEGLSIAEIVEYLSENGIQSECALMNPSATQQTGVPAKEQIALTTPIAVVSSATSLQGNNPGPVGQVSPPVPGALERLPSLSLDSHGHPAYMLNYNLELTWLNEAARKDFFGFDKAPAKSVDRNLFGLLAGSEENFLFANRRELAVLHLQIANERVSLESLKTQVLQNDPVLYQMLEQKDWPVQTGQKSSPKVFDESEFFKLEADGRQTGFRVFSVYFREGVLIVHTPVTELGDALINFLSRRDQVIQTLLRQQLPVLTPLAVLVADIQNSVRICSELPPDEYFELINQIWHTMSQVLRKYKGTHGKHAGDGAVYYFFPQSDSNYLLNALRCADELRAAMAKIHVEWQLRKNWLTELKLNIGLHEGQEWLGAFRSDHHVEFMVLGDTINHASRLSDFAQHGSIWATKNMISRLSADERQLIHFGVLRRSQESGDRFVESSYAQIDSLVSLDQPKHEKLRDIAQLAVTEIRQVQAKSLPK